MVLPVCVEVQMVARCVESISIHCRKIPSGSAKEQREIRKYGLAIRTFRSKTGRAGDFSKLYG